MNKKGSLTGRAYQICVAPVSKAFKRETSYYTETLPDTCFQV